MHHLITYFKRQDNPQFIQYNIINSKSDCLTFTSSIKIYNRYGGFKDVAEEELMDLDITLFNAAYQIFLAIKHMH